MSFLTNAAENLLIDFMRGQGLTLPANMDIALLSAASDSAYTENTWSGYARQPIARTLANWAGTQGAGSVAASSGASHTTSNNAAINFGNVAAGGSGTVNFLGLFLGGTNTLFAYAPLQNPIVLSPGDPVEIQAGAAVFVLGATGGLTDYAANKLLDLIWRGQAYTWPSNTYARLMTSAPSNAGGGTEVTSAGGYAAQALPSTLAFWAGTQGDGSTTASTGTGGKTSNNLAIVYPAPSASWGTVTHIRIDDAAGVGANPLFWCPLGAAKTIVGGGPAPRFNATDLSVTFS